MLCQPWFYLRLDAYSFFWLSEGAYGYSRDSVPKHLFRLTRLWMLTLEPERLKNQRLSPEMNLSGWIGSTDAQAACCCKCPASKRTPFFQITKVIAAIFRASVRRAIGGFIPRARSAA